MFALSEVLNGHFEDVICIHIQSTVTSVVSELVHRSKTEVQLALARRCSRRVVRNGEVCAREKVSQTDSAYTTATASAGEDNTITNGFAVLCKVKLCVITFDFSDKVVNLLRQGHTATNLLAVVGKKVEFFVFDCKVAYTGRKLNSYTERSCARNELKLVAVEYKAVSLSCDCRVDSRKVGSD